MFINPTIIITAEILCLIALCYIGFCDLRYRLVEHEIAYILMLVCGIFTGTSFTDKAIGLLGLPIIMIVCALILSKIKNVECTSLIGGADIKTIAATGFAYGPYALLFALFLSVFEAIPFIKHPKLWMKDKNSESSGGVPFCTLLAFNILALEIWQLSTAL